MFLVLSASAWLINFGPCGCVTPLPASGATSSQIGLPLIFKLGRNSWETERETCLKGEPEPDRATVGEEGLRNCALQTCMKNNHITPKVCRQWQCFGLMQVYIESKGFVGTKDATSEQPPHACTHALTKLAARWPAFALDRQGKP